MQQIKVIVLNPPSPDASYINRDQMGGMGQKINFGSDFKARILSRLKSNFIHLPVVQLVYAATLLIDNGFDVKVIDALNEDIDVDEMIKAAEEFTPDFLVMSISSSCLLFERDVVARRFKDVYPNIRIITVGDALSYETAEFKTPFDIAVIGEVETVIVDICGSIKPLSQIDGVIYSDKGTAVIRDCKKKLSPSELDKLPFPRWDIFPRERYTYYPLLFDAPAAILQSSRGCPYGCGYCSYPVNQGLPWRARSAENIVEEIEQDVNKYGFKAVVFRDPLFSLDLNRVSLLCDLIKQKNLKLIFSFETRPELLNLQIIDKLYAAGCRAINFGVEDIHPEILKMINRKPIDKEHITHIVNHAEQVGIRTTCFFILGLPGSTRQSISETLDFSRSLNPSHADYKVATPYPGTQLYSTAKKNNWITSEGYDNFGGYSSTMRINEELNPEFLENACNDAFNNFYIRPAYFFRELKRGNIIKKLGMIIKSLRVLK